VAKLKDTFTGDSIAAKDHQITLEHIHYPEAAIAFAVEPKARGDEDKLGAAIHRIIEEDPTIKFARDEQTKEFLISGQGQLHVEIVVAKLKKKYNVDVVLHPPKVPYRETITKPADAHGRHKKQSGGHGQFGDCKIRVEPLPRGSDFQFEDDIFGGSIPRQFVPAVEKGIQESRMRGYLAGYPMVDFKATVFDGSYHAVDSNELSFKMAGSLVDSLADDFKPDDYDDTYRDRVVEMIEAKAKGKQIVQREPDEPAEESDLFAALEASLKGMK
jgi:elongation factor G